MKAAFLIVAFAASLSACDKPEAVPATAEPPAAVTPQAEPDAPAIVPSLPALQTVASPAPVATASAAVRPAVARSAAEAAPGTSDLAHGQRVYSQACAFCHDKGVAGAPKAGDAAAWRPRLARGMDSLYASARLGKGAMPAKGGNPALADADVEAAVDYLAAQTRRITP
jgi:cytochrome c5